MILRYCILLQSDYKSFVFGFNASSEASLHSRGVNEEENYDT